MEWISVDDRLPEEGQPVTYWFEPFNQEFDGWFLGMDDDSGCLAGFGSKYGFNFGPEVTHWKPREEND